MAQMYKQCRLQRLKTEMTSWIPSQFAVVGKYLRIKGQNGWRVISVGGTLSGKYLLKHERDYLTQREASDI